MKMLKLNKFYDPEKYTSIHCTITYMKYKMINYICFGFSFILYILYLRLLSSLLALVVTVVDIYLIYLQYSVLQFEVKYVVDIIL